MISYLSVGFTYGYHMHTANAVLGGIGCALVHKPKKGSNLNGSSLFPKL